MNHIYRIVWNHATACYQAVTESAKGQGKNKSQIKKPRVSKPTEGGTLGNLLRVSTIGAIVSLSLLSGLINQAYALNINTAPGFLTNTLPINDDESTGLVPIGFSANLFGVTHTQAYVNNNGNISFGAPMSEYIPFSFANPALLPVGVTGLIAPFFSDVVTWNSNNIPVTYGNSTVNGHVAFGVNYSKVGGFALDENLVNSFQLILIARPDTGLDNFDIQFNYDQIQWDEQGRVIAGFTNGSGIAGTFYEIPGSTISGAFLDTGLNALILGSNVNTPGRFVFAIRAGKLVLVPITSIDTAKMFYSTGDLGINVNPAFEGGTLKVNASNTYAQNFTISKLGGTIDANGKAATFSGVFSDLTAGIPGALTITDSAAGGVVTLSGVNTYTGVTTVAGGTLALAGSGSIATSSGVNLSAAGAKFDVSGVTSKATTIQDLSGVAGTTVNTGATVLTVGTANSTTFAGEFTGSGGLNKVGSGTLEITGNSAAFTGQNTVNAGHLKVNGYLGGSSLDVGSGSLLSGSGTVGGQTTIRSGGTISPGNSIGTLNVAGNFAQEGGSNYEVQVDPSNTASDRIAVSGSANLGGGSQLHVSKTSGQNYVLETKYTILSASGGVNGKYTLSGDTAVSAFYNLQDQYDANNVYLTVAQTTPFQSAGETFNQIATGAGLQSLPRGGKLRNLIGNMQDFSTARGAFDQMSGEIYASMAGARMNDASEVRQAATNRLRSAFCADSMSTAPAATSADAAAVQTCQANPDKAVRWAQVLGTRATTNGDGNAASLDHNGSGLVIGADMKVGEATRAGIFFNAKNSTYSVNDRLSSAKQQDVGVGVYASGKALESVNMDYRVGGTYTQHDVTASRRVNFKGLDESLKANFKANTMQIFGEVGSRVTLSSDFMIEPFANLAFVRNDQKAFDEQPVAESTAVSALHSVKKSQDMAFATIGMRAAADYMMGNAKLSARGMVGLRNAISKNVPLSTHQFSQSDEFTVAGVPVAKNQLVTEVGVGYDINDQISVGVSYTGQFASGSRNQGLKATLEIKF